MKLTWKRVSAHTKHPFRIAREGSSVAKDGKHVERVIVAIEHGGVVGLGEAAPTPHYNQSLDTVEATLQQVGDALGNDPAEINAIIDRLLDRFDDQRASVAAIDAALHDWLGKRRGQPVWDILGLDPSRTPPTSMTVGIDTPERMTAKVDEIQEFHIIKVKVGTERDVEIVRTIRAAASDRKIRVDANCGWAPSNAPARMREILPFDLELIEQPTTPGEFATVRELADLTDVPIIADEDSIRPADVKRLAGVYDGINIKLSKCGGIREAVRMIELARQNDMLVMLGCMVENLAGCLRHRPARLISRLHRLGWTLAAG